MSTPYLRWILSGCWIAAVAIVFVAIDASSTRSWLYVAAIALAPPIVLVRLWPQTDGQTIADVMHGRGERL